jgi:hypothetical protein
MTEYQSHEAAHIFPLMQGADFDELVADIKENGLKERIILLDGRVLDGRNRLRAALAAGVKPEFLNFTSGDPQIGDPLRFVISKNLHRRHLDTGQRASIAAKFADMRQGERTDLEPSANLQKVSQEEAADMMNVSTRSVADAKAVHDHGSPELNAALDAGEIKVSNAAEMSKTQTHAEQRETLEEMRARERRQKEETKARNELPKWEKKTKQGKPYKRPSKGRDYIPRGSPVERKVASDTDLAAKLNPLFQKLWQLSVDPKVHEKKSEIRNLAAKIETLLMDKGHVPTSDRIRDEKSAKAYLAKLKPMSASKAADADAKPDPEQAVH